MARVIEPSDNPCYVIVLRDDGIDDSFQDFVEKISFYVANGWLPADGICQIEGSDAQPLYYKHQFESGR